MHSIKKAARRNAWYSVDEDEYKTYNPFSRATARHRRTPEDGESSIQHVRTEGDNGPSTLEHARKRQSVDENGLRRRHSFEGLSPIQRLGTYPPSQPPAYPTNIAELPARTSVEKDSGEVIVPSHTPAVPHVAFDDLNDMGGQRKRRPRKFLPWKKDQDGDETESIEENKKKKKYPKLTVVGQVRALMGTWISLLFVCVPAGFAISYTHQPPVAVFVVNFLAIIPSAAALGFAVDQILLYVGNTLGGLISMSFGNAVQLISSILLLKTRQILVLRSSLIGTMLQNLLLMTGLSFFLGGLHRTEQYFNITVAQTMGMFLLLAVLSLTVPTVSQLWGHSTPEGIRQQSRGTAVVIMFSYGMWLFFQLRTHRDFFQEPPKKSPKKSSGKKEEGDVLKSFATIGAGTGAAASGGMIHSGPILYEDEEEEIPELTLLSSLLAILISTTILAFNTQFATDSIQGLMATHNISASFMGIVVLPILSNDPFSIDSAIKDKLDISLALTLERCMQTALMVVPLIVLIAWGMKIDEMTLDFDGFAVAALFASIVIVTYVVQEGKSNWLTGALLIKVFIIIGLASFYID